MNCPKCGSKLETLTSIEQCYRYYEFDGEEYDEIDEESGYDVGVYVCPGCGVELAYTEEEAKAILEDKITSEMGQRFAEIALEGK